MGIPVIRVLIVTDDIGSFAPNMRFGLTELVATLTKPLTFAKFEVTRAHRNKVHPLPGGHAGADITGFVFSDAALSAYDQVWLFGVATPSDLPRLSAVEVAALKSFMQRGGGVFATGDHENLGASLCDQIPRVRSMRRWKWPDSPPLDIYESYPEESDLAPPVYGVHRHDTTQAGRDGVVQFDDQSDDVPQTIQPKMYMWSGAKRSALTFEIQEIRQYPHPLLCTSSGPIRILPDHMHEGECVEPTALDPAEYPTASTNAPSPQIIAWAKVTGGKITPVLNKDVGDGDLSKIANPFGPYESDDITRAANKAPTVAEEFGAIAAYDGHHAAVGRVVLDSTFHHFVDVNLIASHVLSTEPSKQKGFLSSVEGRAAYAKIQSYFRNIAIWLAPPDKQDAMFLASLAATTKLGAFDEIRNAGRFAPHVLGEAGRDALGRIVSPCTAISWVGKIINIKVFEPWKPRWELDSPALRVRGLPDAMLTAATGGIMREVLRTAESHGVEAIAARGAELVRRGAGAGVRELHATLQKHARVIEEGAGALAQLGASLEAGCDGRSAT